MPLFLLRWKMAVKHRKLKIMYLHKIFQSVILFWTVLILSLLPTTGQALTQEDTEDAERPAALTASEIPAEAEEASTYLTASIFGSRTPTGIIEIEHRLDQTDEDIRQLVQKTAGELESQLSLSSLEDLKSSLQRQDHRLRNWRDQITAESGLLENLLDQIRQRRKIWSQTESASKSENYPESVVHLITQTLAALDQGREAIVERRSHLLRLQNSIVALRGQIHESLSAVTAAENLGRSRLFSFDGPPLWDLAQIDPGRIWPRFRDQLVKDYASFKDYASKKSHWIIVSVFVLLITVLMLMALRKRLVEELDSSAELSGAKQVLDHPLASAIVILTLIGRLISSDAPHSWFNAVTLLQVVALLPLLPGLVPSRLLVCSYLVMGLRMLALFNSPIPEESSLGHVLTLLIILLSISSLFWFKGRIQSGQELRNGWSTILYLASWCGILVLSAAVISGILGNLALAGILAEGTIRTASIALFMWVAFCVFRGMLFLVLQTNTAQRFQSVRRNRDLILRRTRRAAGALTILAFVMAVPRFFSVFDPLAASVAAIVTTQITFGELSFSFADVFIFFFLIWLSFRVARLICFILDEDFLPRLVLPRGVPAAVSRLTYYAILFFGFLLSLTASGWDLSRFAILAGAFGVGIGFGLQNIVNNFVSGLILLFERPIHVGDKIQLAGDLTGEVVRIGIRASAVRTFDGAEVLVPNGHLISNELTNWTLSDRQRRITIPVGVAYGTDPQQVLDLLKQVAETHPEVLREPDPRAFFMGFGDSALDFTLRVWVANFEVGFQVRSDLAVAINAALKEAGISIPFPQRDLHLRSVDSDAKLQVESVATSTDREIKGCDQGD